MISPRKLAANRANARRSTGPRTREGKRRSSRNALKHGLSVRIAADPAELAAMVKRILDDDERLTSGHQNFGKTNPPKVQPSTDATAACRGGR